MIVKSEKFGSVDATFVWRTYLHIGGEVQTYAYVSPNDRSDEFMNRARKKNKQVSLQSSFPIFIAWAVRKSRLMGLNDTAELWNEIKDEVQSPDK